MSSLKEFLGLENGLWETVDFFESVVNTNGETGGGGDAKTTVEWMGAVMTGTEANPFSTEDFCEVMGVEVIEGEGEAT